MTCLTSGPAAGTPDRMSAACIHACMHAHAFGVASDRTGCDVTSNDVIFSFLREARDRTDCRRATQRQEQQQQHHRPLACCSSRLSPYKQARLQGGRTKRHVSFIARTSPPKAAASKNRIRRFSDLVLPLRQLANASIHA